MLQRYAFLLKDAKILGKMFEGEGDKKGVSRMPDEEQKGYTFTKSLAEPDSVKRLSLSCTCIASTIQWEVK